MNTNIKYQAEYWLAICYDNIISKNGIYVLGYTKTGTNWMCNLIQEYLRIGINSDGKKDDGFFRQRVHHIHRFLPFGYYKKNLIYMARDGREAIVSRYFTLINQKTQRYTKRDFVKYSGIEPTKENITEVLPDFIRFLMNYNGSSIDYVSHVKKAIKNDFFIIRYEDLHDNTEKALTKALLHLNPDLVIDSERVKKTIEYCSINSAKKRTGKDSGFFRKDGGKKGTWRKYFNQESAQVFASFANEELIKLGYEDDVNWVNDFK